MCHGFKVLHIPGNANNYKITFACDIVALLNQWLFHSFTPECLYLFRSIPFEFDNDNKGHAHINGSRIYNDDIALYYSTVTQTLDATLNCRH